MKKYIIGKNKSSEAGFTLAEALVTVFIFSLILTVVVGILVSVLVAQRKVTAQRKVEQNVRVAMDDLVRDIRGGKIDYSKQSKFDGADEIYLYLPNGSDGRYYWDASSKNLYLSTTGFPLLSSDIKISNMKFYIAPTTSPYLGGTATEQSRVTIFIEAETEVLGQKASTSFQTTVASRIYEK
ncbi:type II secretion system GspH family protein [Patescibacteria group bacterium]|nr:type II secretion system GspH family protein [Patescibacteria group bacterium]